MIENDPAAPLLCVQVDGVEIASIAHADIPCEVTGSQEIAAGAEIAFILASGERHVHALGAQRGWAHVSVRVHAGLGCQADCAITATEHYDPQDLLQGNGSGIRFQPFFLPGALVDPEQFRGKGLFARGLHFSGLVTPSSVRLSCECDACHRSFVLQSFHAGFSNADYMYSGSGRYTLLLDAHVPGVSGALGSADPDALARLEASLPPAPDGTAFRYLNPLRCPHCAAPFIDFERFPEQRAGEYYGNTLFGTDPIRYVPPQNPARKGWFTKLRGA